MGVILLATLIFPCRPMPLGASPHRKKLKMHFFLHHCPGTRCKAYLQLSDPAAKFGSIPPCKICAKKITFSAYQVSLVFKKMLFIFVSASSRHHVNPVYLSAGEPYSQLSSHSWRGSGWNSTRLVEFKSQHLGRQQWVPALSMSPHTAGGQPDTPAGSAKGVGAEGEFYLFGKHSNTMEMKAA